MSKYLFVFLALLLFPTIIFPRPKTPDARNMVERALTAMGGADKLKAIKSIHTHSVGHFYLLEQSERPDGPWLSVNQATEEWRDVEHGWLRRSFELSGVYTGKTIQMVVDGTSFTDSGGGFAPDPDNLLPVEELLAMAPERVLFNALDSPDLHYIGEERVQGTVNDIVRFTWKGSPVKIYLNRDTGMLTLTDVVKARPTDLFWGIWGDFSVKNYYSFWNLEKGGIHYPQQTDTYYNGQPFRTDTIVDLEFNAPLPAESFAVTNDLKSKYASSRNPQFMDLPLGRADRPPVDVAKDFTVIRGNWNVTLVKQDDGIVVIEAPISSRYSVKVIDEIKRRYPNEKIKCVISTADAFPHFGGIRQYVAEGIPVYILDLNKPIIERLLAAKYTTYPDDLEKDLHKKQAKLNIVSGKTVIGSGTNELDLYPIRTETGERMIMIYAPQLKVLYGADLVQPLPKGGFFMPQYITELRDAADREKLNVERVFALHSPPLEWRKVLDTLNDGGK
jgi:hypothetical protein